MVYDAAGPNGTMPNLDLIPMSTPLPGYTSNLENPGSRAYQYYASAGVGTFLMLLFVVARFYVRLVRLRSPWWDDLACFVATGCVLAFTGYVIKLCQIGIGRHIWDIPLSHAAAMRNTSLLSEILTGPAIGITKLTLLLLYLRLFSINERVRTGTYTIIVLCFIFYTTTTFVYIFDQSDAAWVKLTYSVGIFGVISDFFILSLPVFALYQLNMSTKKKVGVMAVFLTGTLGFAMSLVGCIFRYRFSANPETAADISVFLIPIYIVITIEMNIGLICACMPIVAALFKDRKPKTSIRSSWGGVSMPRSWTHWQWYKSSSNKSSKTGTSAHVEKDLGDARSLRFKSGYVTFSNESESDPMELQYKAAARYLDHQAV